MAHVGDSRVYRLQNGVLHQLTFDHSLVWEMRHLGGQTEIDTAGIPKNVITRSLGPHAEVKVDLEGPFALELGDTFLICSDGLTGCVSDEEIAATLNWCSVTDATRLLLGLAVLRGAPDNVTMIVARVSDAKMTTRAHRADPLTVGESHEPHAPAPTWAWVGFGLLLLLACGLWALGYAGWALLAAGAAAIPGILILAMETGVLREGGVPLVSGRRLGKAPYQKITAMKQAQFAEHVAQAVQQGCAVAKEKNWEVDWEAVDRLSRTSHEFRRTADPQGGITSAAQHPGPVSGYLSHLHAQRGK